MKIKYMALICLTAFVTTSSALQYGDFTYTVDTNLNTVTITDYTGSGGDLDIPDMIDGKPVAAINGGSFQDNATITSLSFPGSITTIGGFQFNGMTSLTNLSFSEGFNSFTGPASFVNCYSLTSISFPSSLTEIHFECFANCYSLTSVTFPESFAVIWGHTFKNCTNMAGAYFRGDQPSIGTGGAEEDVFPFATVYYLPNSTGWEDTFVDRPTELWNPSIQTSNENFGAQSNLFGFDIINGTTNALVQIETCTNLSEEVWMPVITHTMTNGTIHFSDPSFSNHPNRFYRLDMPD